jgi:hypothetical protein
MDPVQAFMQANGLTAPLFPPTSRYYGLASAQLTNPDGSVVTYLRRRFLPPPEHFATLAEHQVVSGDRVDNLAARYLGDAEQYWRLCDANGTMNPAELTATIGSYVRITLPEGVVGGDDVG